MKIRIIMVGNAIYRKRLFRKLKFVGQYIDGMMFFNDNFISYMKKVKAKLIIDYQFIIPFNSFRTKF